MPEQYTIKQVIGEADLWKNNHGNSMATYELMLEGPAGLVPQTVTLNQREETKAPTEGQQLDGDIDFNAKRGPKFEKDWSNYNKGGGNGSQRSSNGSSGDGDEFARRPDHPSVEARAKHSTAIGAAPKYLDLWYTSGLLTAPQNNNEAKAQAKGVIDWLVSTYPAIEQTSDDDIPFS